MGRCVQTVGQGGHLKGSLGFEGWKGNTRNTGKRNKMETMWESSNAGMDFGEKP